MSCFQTWRIFLIDGDQTNAYRGLTHLLGAAPLANGRRCGDRFASVLPDYLLDALGFMRDPDPDLALEVFAPMPGPVYQRRHPSISCLPCTDEWMLIGEVTLRVPEGVHRLRRAADEHGRDLPLRPGERDWRTRWNRRNGLPILSPGQEAMVEESLERVNANLKAIWSAESRAEDGE